MKTKKTPINLPSINRSLHERCRIPLALVSVVILTMLALSVKAGNILINSKFATQPIFAPGSWSQHATETWSMNSASAADGSSVKLIYPGDVNGLWMQGLYQNGGAASVSSYAAQDFSTTPGSTYSADAFYSAYVYFNGGLGGLSGNSGLFQADVPPSPNDPGEEDGWVEVLFYNSANVVLADYKSTIINAAYEGWASGTNYTPGTATETLVTNSLGNIYLGWQDFAVTNQYDVSTIQPDTDPAIVGSVTNTLGAGQVITAPAGAVTVEFRISMYQYLYEGGAPFWANATLNQLSGASPSVIGNVSPDGSKFFNGTNTAFKFTVTSASTGGAGLPSNPTSGIGVVVNGVSESANLQFSGASTNLSVTLPGLVSNSLYTVSVSVTNSGGLTSFESYSFDTFPSNTFVVFAEDYDYTNGQFIENPIPTAAPAPNSYYGTGGTLGTDLNTYLGTGTLPGNGASQTIRSDGYSAIQTAEDIQFPIYAAQNNPSVFNVQIAYNNDGNWFNYSRVYPTGNYLVYLRYNNDAAGNVESVSQVTGGVGTSSQTTNALGEFIGANTGAGYAWTPLTDPYGNKIIVNLAAGQTNTLQLLSGNGGLNGDIVNFVAFAFVPAGTSFPPVIGNLNPNNVSPPVNKNIFLSVTDITYSVSSTFSTVATSHIQTWINGVNESSTATYTGSSTNWSVSVPCPQNELISLFVQAVDATGATNSVSETFDTFTQSNLMIEALDFNFNGGQFIDNPTPTAPLYNAADSYFNGGFGPNGSAGPGTNVAVVNVDYLGVTNDGVAWAYRPLDTFIGQEVTADFLRYKFTVTDAEDYDLGYYNAGFWENYTRTFPANHYNVYARLAGGNGPFSGTTLSLVTSSSATSNQTTRVLGSFADANAAGWAVWHWVPMLDTHGNLATVSLGGVQTVRLTSGNNLNAHFLMFVPTESAPMTASASGKNVSISFPTMAGYSYTVLYNSTLTGGTWQTLSAGISGDGTVKTVNDTTTSGQTRFYKLQIQVQY
jgi:hypothetical protein